MDESLQDVVAWLEQHPAMWLLIWETREQDRRAGKPWELSEEWAQEIIDAFPGYDPVTLKVLCETATDLLEKRGRRE